MDLATAFAGGLAAFALALLGFVTRFAVSEAGRNRRLTKEYDEYRRTSRIAEKRADNMIRQLKDRVAACERRLHELERSSPTT